MRLKDKVALITGGGAGIGKATAELFAREGACVTIVELDAEAGKATCRQIIEHGGRALFVRADVSKPDDVEAAVQQTVAQFGHFNVLYNNVGGSTMRDGSVLTAPFEEFRNKIDVDLFGPWLGAKYAAPEMIKSGGGSIVNASSICAFRAMPNRAAYTAAKGGLTALTQQMAGDLARYKIRVNAVAPGSVLTERVIERRKTHKADQTMLDRHLLGLLDPLDIAHAVLYFASDESRRTTGQVLTVDSGFTIT